jgi:hypothetical protein
MMNNADRDEAEMLERILSVLSPDVCAEDLEELEEELGDGRAFEDVANDLYVLNAEERPLSEYILALQRARALKAEARNDRLDALYREALDTIKARRDAEVGQFYNAPEAIPDVESWMQRAYWTVDEATALLLGREPSVVKPKSLRDRNAKSSRLAKEYWSTRELITRALEMGVVGEGENVRPGSLLGWAHNHGIPKWHPDDNIRDGLDKDVPPLPKDITSHELRLRYNKLKSSKAKQDAKTAQLVAYLAFKAFQFNPRKPGSDIVGKIYKALTKEWARTVTIDEDTLRARLSEAAEAFPDAAGDLLASQIGSKKKPI